jgi:hypothetical protein
VVLQEQTFIVCGQSKICQTGLLKLNFETIPKKRIFRFFPKIFAGHG